MYAGPCYVDEQGLVVTPDFPRALEACAFREVVPVATLHEFAAPDSILGRLER